ncbi:MAG: S9 family peptidase [Acidobacteriota bacterium]|nr:S9 family peptidase [Acidobacteriota bacterium]
MNLHISAKSPAHNFGFVVVSASVVLCAASYLFAQEKNTAQDSTTEPASQLAAPARDKSSAKVTGNTRKEEDAQEENGIRGKTGTKQTVEARLKAAEKPKGKTPTEDVEKTLFATRRFEQTVISPDGKRVAWVETLVGKDGAAFGKTAIYVADAAANATPRRLTVGAAAKGESSGIGAGAGHEEGNVAWSPDSKRIAFLSDAAKTGQRQLYVVNAAGGVARKMTSVKGFLAAPAWSPDGQTIAVLFTENATRAAGPLVAETPATGEIKDAFYEQRIAVIDVASGKLRQISPADTYIYEYDWSPDGLRFVVTAALGNGDNNWWIAELYTLEATSGLMKAIYKPQFQIANPVWSPDGERIAFIEGLMSDEGLTGGDIYTVSAAAGESQNAKASSENSTGANVNSSAENLTPEMKVSASWITWTPEKKIILGEYVGGDAGIASVDPTSKKIEPLWRGGETLTTGGTGTTLSIARDGKTMAFVRHSYAAPPEVWAGVVGDWKQITRRNESVTRVWGDAKSISWKSGGHDVQGWLVYPRNFDATRKYPLVLYVHGGPSYAYLSHWPSTRDYGSALAGAGYFVLLPNPRGSFGQGGAFTRANVKDFGEGDFQDILAGVDEAIRIAPIDPDRLGLTGWSYGGFMTMLGVTKTNRFKAAVAGAGISNWQSYYGENSIDQWMIPFFGKSVYDDPEIYAKSSAVNFIKKVKTPTLIVVGDSDGECPTPQSYEFWHALKAEGVETQLVVYEHEGHMFVKPAHQRDVIERTLAWFDGRLK